MAKDLSTNTFSWKDGSGSAASSFPASIVITISENATTIKNYLCNITDIFISLDKENNAFFIYYQNHKLYQWTLDDTLNGNPITTAEDMFNGFKAYFTA